MNIQMISCGIAISFLFGSSIAFIENQKKFGSVLLIISLIFSILNLYMGLQYFFKH